MKNRVKNIFKRFRTILLLSVGIGLLPQLAQASMTPAQYPWPWPWAIGCKIRWSDVRGTHGMVEGSEGDTFTIWLTHESKKIIGVHVRRTDRAGVSADGYKPAGLGSTRVVVKMVPYRQNQEPYQMQIRMGLFETFKKNKDCPPDQLKTVVTIIPISQKDQLNYTLDPAAQN